MILIFLAMEARVGGSLIPPGRDSRQIKRLMSDLIKKILIVCVCVWYFSSRLLCIIVLLNDSLKIPAAASALCVVTQGGELRDESEFIFKDRDEAKSLKKV